MTSVKTPVGRIKFDGIQKPAESQKTGVYKASFRIGHCLLRKQRYAPRPNAVFRRFALESTSYNVLLPHLDHQDFLRQKAFVEGLKRAGEAIKVNTDQILGR